MVLFIFTCQLHMDANPNTTHICTFMQFTYIGGFTSKMPRPLERTISTQRTLSYQEPGWTISMQSLSLEDTHPLTGYETVDQRGVVTFHSQHTSYEPVSRGGQVLSELEFLMINHPLT